MKTPLGNLANWLLCCSVACCGLAGCNKDAGPPPKGAPSDKDVDAIDINVSPPTSSPQESSGDPASAPADDKGPSSADQGVK